MNLKTLMNLKNRKILKIFEKQKKHHFLNTAEIEKWFDSEKALLGVNMFDGVKIEVTIKASAVFSPWQFSKFIRRIL